MGYHGKRCEYVFNPEIYGFSIEKDEVETAEVSTLVTFLVVGIVAVAALLQLYRR